MRMLGTTTRGLSRGETSHPGPTVPDAGPQSGATPACRHWDLAGPRGGEPRTPGGEEMPEANPMSESRHGHPYSPLGQHKNGPRESARYGYKGTILGDASHPGPAPPATDMAGTPAPGSAEVHASDCSSRAGDVEGRRSSPEQGGEGQGGRTAG